MGSICWSFPISKWKIIDRGNLKSNNDPVVCVEIGEWEDTYSGGTTKVWMKEEVYQKILNGEYKVTQQPYSEPPIIVNNKDSKVINLLYDTVLD